MSANCTRQEPFGIWHEGETEEESDFFLFKDAGDVSCDKCIKLYRLPPNIHAIIEQAKREEREECAKVCDGKHEYMASRCADAIRERGGK